MSQRTPEQNGYQAIGAYAVIGNCRSAALISRDGSLDWLCLPRFDSPSIFAALLDDGKGGRFRIRPTGAFTSSRSYLSNTPILETLFETATGTIVLRDLFAVSSEEEKRRVPVAGHEILREVEGVSGEVEMEILYQPRPDYARGGVELEQRNRLGLWCRCCGGTALLVSEVPLAAAPGGSEARARVVIGAGERRWLSFSYCAEAPAVIPPLGAAARERYQTSLRWWRDWEGRCGYHGPFRDEVLRSAMVLKLMIYAPSGAIVASPTTSLPERIGGIRNWDYRYCWLRDASFTLRALFSLGYTDDEAAFVDWLLHLTRLTWPELQVLYDVFGESELPERELGHLEGYARSRPVHVGNGSHAQFQLDVYGELIEAMSAFVRRGGTLNRGTVGMLNRLGKTVCGHWREPDNGIWEMRAGRRHHTYSKVLAWVALDRLIALHEMGYAPISAKLFRGERDALRGEIERRGYNERLNSYTSSFDGEQVDASLLLLPFYGYIAADAPRMRSSYALIRERLGRGSLLYRYERGADDGLPPGEGSFGICAFWEAGYLAESGDLAGARRSFEELLAYGNDLGLFAEEIGEDGAALGNFPQAFTHIGLINAALTLAEKERT